MIQHIYFFQSLAIWLLRMAAVKQFGKITRSIEDKRHYRGLELSNKLKVLPVFLFLILHPSTLPIILGDPNLRPHNRQGRGGHERAHRQHEWPRQTAWPCPLLWAYAIPRHTEVSRRERVQKVHRIGSSTHLYFVFHMLSSFFSLDPDNSWI